MNNIAAKITLGLALSLTSFYSIAQNGSHTEYLPIVVVAARQQNIPESVNTYIENKLNQVVSQYGLGSADYYDRFILTASIVPVTKDVVAGPPAQIAENVDVTFYIVDNVDRKIFSSTTVSTKAVDVSEEKLLNKAIRSIKVNTPQIQNFVNKGKTQIINYYNSQADRIISNAKLLAKQRNYEAAFFELSMIPEACGAAYDRAIAAAAVIYQEYVDYIGEINLAKAKAAWAAQQNMFGAAEAGEYLSKILPDAKCYGRAEDLYKEIKAKVLDDWHFEMSVYRDGVSLEKARIEAWKEVGVAYGRNQKADTYNITWLVR